MKGPLPLHAGPPSHRFRVGPFTLLATAAAAVVLWAQTRFEHPQPPVILPAQVVSSGAPRWMPEPVSALLLHRKDLRIRPDQERQVREIALMQTRTARPLLARMDEDRAKMDRFVRQARQRGGASPAALQELAAPFVADSAELATQRRVFWSQALEILTAAQRLQAERVLHPALRRIEEPKQ